jgi:hypothetical protein
LKKWLLIIAALAVLGYVAYTFHLLIAENRPVNANEYRVLIAYHKAYRSNSSGIMEAYQSVLAEEGVPCEAVDIEKLCAIPAGQAAKNIPAVIFPDALLQSMPGETLAWTKDYLHGGGSLAIIYDAGIKENKGKRQYLTESLLMDIVGINYITFEEYQEKSYTTGNIRFRDQSAAVFFEIPPGKLTEDFFLSGYYYGALDYPIARTRYTAEPPPETVFARMTTRRGESFPAVILKKYGRGNVLYVNMPLGHLKANSDDMPLRLFLRTFLFRVVKMPHLVNTRQATGKLVINWHIDSNGEWQYIPAAIANEYLDSGVRASIHITAGDFRDRPGDGLGFDACGKGKTYARRYLPYGIIGSHGGWAHNWFAGRQNALFWTDYHTKNYIKKNAKCLESITGYRLREYSAPDGVHPQPETTEILETLGFNSYYYTGDSGSAPNRTFYGNKIVSENVVAFPVLPNGKYASLSEMKRAGIKEDDVRRWMIELVDYVIEKRTARLFYSHINDTFNYPKAMHDFIRYAKIKQEEGKLQIEPMSEIADFFIRFMKTKYNFRRQENNLSIHLKNENGLLGVTVAAPRQSYRVNADPDIMQSEDQNYHYLTVRKNVKEKIILVHSF